MRPPIRSQATSHLLGATLELIARYPAAAVLLLSNVAAAVELLHSSAAMRAVLFVYCLELLVVGVFSAAKLVVIRPLGGAFPRAIPYLRRACDGGDASSCYFWALCHELGLGVAKNRQAALEAYERACTREHRASYARRDGLTGRDSNPVPR